jgi:scyllo-inositol 2-dehydrogenase (NADP+)
MAGRGFHCYLVKLTPGLVLRGVVARKPEVRERIQAEQGCRAYESVEAALADPDVDLIVLATPNSTHADLAVQALNARKHVVTDKVMCLTLADCDRMIAAARKNNVLLSVFQNRRFDGDFLTVKKLIADGELGEVRWIEMAWQGFGAWGGWRGQSAMGGGKFFDLGAHLVDQLCLLCPARIASVYCRMHHDLPQTDTESEALLVVAFENGVTGVCDFSSLAALSKPRFYVRGRKATFRKDGLDPQEAAMRAGNIDAAVEPPALYGVLHDGKAQRTIPTLAGRWRNYYESVAATLRESAPPCVQHQELRRAISILEAGVRSAQRNEVVRFL